MVRQRIILMVGLPGSGKSTWLEQRGITPLSSDWMRMVLADDMTDQTIHARVFQSLRYLLRQRLAIGRPETYVDATHLTVEERRPYIQIAGLYGCDAEAVFFDVGLEVCLERNRARDRVVPEEAMRMMAAKLRPPSVEEGFARVTVVTEPRP
jgi:predicted kinase